VSFDNNVLTVDKPILFLG